MNPPFLKAGERMGNKRVANTAEKHIDQILERLEPGGRLVAIVGENLNPGNAVHRPWF